MEISFDDFTQCCPAGQAPDSDIFNSIGAQILHWKDFARELATPRIYDGIDKIDAQPVNEDYDRLVRLRKALVGMVCSLAFEEALPQLDLVLTNTGFGVVSNQNVAPASADRVKALKTQLHVSGWNYFEDAIDILRYLGAPRESKLCASAFSSLFWRASHLHVFGIPNPSHDDLLEKNHEILAQQPFLIRFISPELFQSLLRAEASASATSMQAILIAMCRVYFAADGKLAKNVQKLAILDFIESHPDDFSEYMDSDTYKANHFLRYENKKDDPCFFFG